jgi:hypothetical protein
MSQIDTTPSSLGRPIYDASTIEPDARPNPSMLRAQAAQREKAVRDAREGRSLIADLMESEFIGGAASTSPIAGIVQSVKQTPGGFGSIGRFLTRAYPNDRDPNFGIDETLLKSLTEGLPEEYWEDFGEARSLAHAGRIREGLLSLHQSRQNIASYGYTGTILALGANILDPVNIATGYAGGLLTKVGKGTRLARLVKGGLVSAAATAPVESVRMLGDPETDATDIVWAAGAAFALGGGVSAIFGGDELAKAGQRTQLAADIKLAESAGTPLTPKGEVALRKGMNNTLGDGILEAEFRDIVPDVRRLPAPDEGNVTGRAATDVPPPDSPTGNSFDEAENATDGPGRGVGAASPNTIAQGIPNAPAGRLPTDFNLDPSMNFDQGSKGRTWLDWMRFGIAGQSVQSESPFVRITADRLVENVLLDAQGSRTTFSASEGASRVFKTAFGGFTKDYDAGFSAWAKGKKYNLLSREYGWQARRDFGREVGMAVRHAPGTYTQDAAVNAAADRVRALNKEMLEFGKRQGIAGFDTIDENPQYLMRVFDHGGINRTINTHTIKKVERVIAESIWLKRKPNSTLTARDAIRISRGYLDNILKQQNISDLDKSLMLSSDKADVLKQGMVSAGIAADEAEDVLKRAGLRQDGDSPFARAKFRLDLDETHSHTYTKPDGTKATIAITDLLENDAMEISRNYTRQMAGAGAMAEVFRVSARSPDDIITSTAQILQRAEKELDEYGVGKARQAFILGRLDTAMKSVLGIPLGRNGAVAHTLRTARSLNYLVRAGQFGFAQAADIGSVLANSTYKAMFNSIPVLRDITKQMVDGTASPRFLDEIEELWGLGLDRRLNPVTSKFDDAGSFAEYAGLNRVDRAMETGKRVMSDLSGLAGINIVLQKWAGANAVNTWIDIASRGSLPSAKRLASMGLDEAMAKRIVSQLNDPNVVETVDGLLGRRVKAINESKWTDREAFAAFVVAVDKWSRRVVQQNDIGQMAPWMTTDAGRTLIQFRTFAVGSWEKGLLFNVQQRDPKAFAAIAVPMFFGGLAYMAMTAINSVGRKDAEKYRNQMLTPDKVAKAAFARGGASSLIPMAVDTPLSWMGYDPVFSFARTSGIENDPLFGNPTLTALWEGKNIARTLRAPLDSTYDYSQEDLRAARVLLPFQNLTGVRNALDAIQTRLPRRSEKGMPR